jgi:hypothetical protein
MGESGFAAGCWCGCFGGGALSQLVAMLLLLLYLAFRVDSTKFQITFDPFPGR